MAFILAMPKLTPTMSEGVIAKLHKKVGEFCEADELFLDIGTDKATIEYHTLDAGYLRKLLVNEGDTILVGAPLAVLSEEKEEDISAFVIKRAEETKPLPIQKKSIEQKKEIAIQGKISASPLARKLAKERGISLETITGTGPRGRIMSRDLDTASTFSINETPLSPVRKVIAEKLSYSKSTIPHFYCSIKVDATLLVAGREELKNIGHSITINDIIIRAVALSLMKHPSIRCSFNPKRSTILSHDHADIAVAVAVPGGLFTPIIFKAEEKSIHEISKEIKELATKAKAGKLLPDEYLGGAFTISNLGMFGIEEFYPIINPPQLAILGVGAIIDTPIVKDGVITLGKILTLCLAADHRALDGTDTAQFLKTLKEFLERPSQLIL